MKKIMIMLAVLLLCGCAVRKEEGKMEIREDIPVKVEYYRMWEYSAYGESEDQEYIQSIVDALKGLSVGEQTDIAVDDFGDNITLIYADGKKETYSFEAEYIVLEDGKRAKVTGNLSYLRSLLSKLIEGED